MNYEIINIHNLTYFLLDAKKISSSIQTEIKWHFLARVSSHPFLPFPGSLIVIIDVFPFKAIHYTVVILRTLTLQEDIEE